MKFPIIPNVTLLKEVLLKQILIVNNGISKATNITDLKMDLDVDSL